MPDVAPATIGDDTRISRGTSLLVAPVNDEIVMMDVQRGHYYGLDRIGADIWSRLETPHTFAALVDSLAADYDAERERIADDVRQLIAIMLRHQVVSLD
jgi:hypothetical protein